MPQNSGGKLSSQVYRQQYQRPTRTQRVIAKQEMKKKQALSQEALRVQQKLNQTRSVEEYSKEYNKLSPDLKSYFLSPLELRQKEEARKKENVKDIDRQLEDKRNFLRQLDEEASRGFPTREGRIRNKELKYEAQAEVDKLNEARSLIMQGYDKGEVLDYVQDKFHAKLSKRKLRQELKSQEPKISKARQKLLSAQTYGEYVRGYASLTQLQKLGVGLPPPASAKVIRAFKPQPVVVEKTETAPVTGFEEKVMAIQQQQELGKGETVAVDLTLGEKMLNVLEGTTGAVYTQTKPLGYIPTAEGITEKPEKMKWYSYFLPPLWIYEIGKFMKGGVELATEKRLGGKRDIAEAERDIKLIEESSKFFEEQTLKSEELSKEIEAFNLKYSTPALTPEIYSLAQEERKELELAQANIERQTLGKISELRTEGISSDITEGHITFTSKDIKEAEKIVESSRAYAESDWFGLKKVREMTTYKLLPKSAEERYGSDIELETATEKVIKNKYLQKATAFTLGWGKSYYHYFREEPVGFATKTAIYSSLGPVFRYTGKFIPIQKSIKISKYLIPTALGVYGTSIGYRVLKQKTPFEAGKKAGEITIKELSPMAVGVSLEMLYPTIKGYFRTLGRKEIPIEKLVPEEVISGKRPFPEASGGKHLKLFKESPYSLKKYRYEAGGYHATGEKWWDEKLIIRQKGTSELPGLYTSYTISPHFTKVISGKAGVYGGNIFQPRLAPSPSVAYIIPKGFRTADYLKIPGVPSRPLGFKWVTSAKAGYLDIPSMKTEVEAIGRVTTPPQVYSLVSKEFFFTWKDVRIPIDVFKYSGIGGTGTSTVIPSSVSSSISRAVSIAPTTSYVFTPSSFLVGSAMSYSYTPYSKISTPSYPAPSFTSISRISKPSSIPKSQISLKKISSKLHSPPSLIKPLPIIYPHDPLPQPEHVPILPVVVPKISLDILKGKIKAKRKKRKGVEEYAYLPGFTAKAIGLAPVKATRKQASKLMRELQTGFEIRRGAVLVRKRRRKKKK